MTTRHVCGQHFGATDAEIDACEACQRAHRYWMAEEDDTGCPYPCTCPPRREGENPAMRLAGGHWDKCQVSKGGGLMCHQHFEMSGRHGRDARAGIYPLPRPVWKGDLESCPDCKAAQAAQTERIQRNETIDPEQPWGQHIALTCRHHPWLRWSTKNISHIGARSVFFSSGFQGAQECECPLSDLVVLRKFEAAQAN